jgi:hypothetical protein
MLGKLWVTFAHTSRCGCTSKRHGSNKAWGMHYTASITWAYPGHPVFKIAKMCIYNLTDSLVCASHVSNLLYTQRSRLRFAAKTHTYAHQPWAHNAHRPDILAASF